MLEKKLKTLFDYQRFEHQAALDSLIAETGERYGRELSDDELFEVNAAGMPELLRKPDGSGADRP